MKTYFFFIPILFAHVFFQSCTKKEEVQVIQLDSNVSEDLNKILFTNDSVGFAVGGTKYLHGIIVKTKDGGNHWSVDTISAPKAFYDIFSFREALYASGYDGFVYRSLDAAHSWQLQGFPSWQRFNQLAVNGEGKLMVCTGDGFERGEILISDNEGSNWRRIDTFNRTTTSIIFHNGVGFCGAYGLIYKSIDNGYSWQALDVKGDFFIDIQFTSDNIGYATGYFGRIYKSTDAGNTWKQIRNENFNLNEKSNFRDAIFWDNYNGCIVGNNGYIIFTKDGGNNWTQVKPFTKNDIHSVSYVNGYLFCSGAGGELFRFSL